MGLLRLAALKGAYGVLLMVFCLMNTLALFMALKHISRSCTCAFMVASEIGSHIIVDLSHGKLGGYHEA